MSSVPPSFEHPGPPPSRPELPEGAPPPQPADDAAALPRLGVPVWTPFVALLATLVAVIFAGLVAAVAIEIAGGDVEADADAPALLLSLTTLQFVLLVGSAWYVVKALSGPPTPASFGLRSTRPWQAIGWTVLAYVAFVLVSLAVIGVLGEPEDQQLVQDIEDEDAIGLLVAYGALSCFVAPICEELFFRGFMFRVLAERIHLAWAALASGAVFGLSHAAGSPATALLVLSGFGVALCLLLWRTRSLIPCIGLHAFNNAISFGATKELPAWGFVLLIAGSVGATLAVSVAVSRRYAVRV